jgi:hypothetical protein
LKDHYAAAQSDKDRAAICSHVEGVANGFQAMTQASISLAGAIKSGDPFAISASSLDLATSLVGTVSLFGGPIRCRGWSGAGSDTLDRLDDS